MNEETRAFLKRLPPDRLELIRYMAKSFSYKDIKLVPSQEKTTVNAPREWSEKDAWLISQFNEFYNSNSLPIPPFNLDAATTITGERLYKSLRTDIEQGPNGARARTGALQKDLVKLIEIINQKK